MINVVHALYIGQVTICKHVLYQYYTYNVTVWTVTKVT